MIGKRFLGVIVALALASIVAGCGLLQEDTPTPPPTSTPLPTLTPTPQPTPTKGVELPADAFMLREEYADLNGDGREEHIVAFGTGSALSREGDGLAIDDWEMSFPSDQRFHDLQLRVIEFGSPPRVLAFTEGDDGVSKFLYVSGWTGSTFEMMSPHGGPLDGELAFRSAHYWPLVEDGDFNGTEEISVLKEAENPDFLEVLFYEWDSEAFRYSTLFISIPKAAPERGGE